MTVYDFPSRPPAGLLLGLTPSRLALLGLAGVVFVAAMTAPTLGRLTAAAAVIGLFVVVASVRVGGRVLVEWVGVVVGFGWARVSGNDRFRSAPQLVGLLPAGVMDLPGELAGLDLRTATVAGDGGAAFGVVADMRWRRLVAVAELSGEDFLFLDPAGQQARIAGWGRTLDHIADTLPDITRIQVVHLTADHHHPAQHTDTDGVMDGGGHGAPDVADSYRDAVTRAAAAAQQHRVLLAIGLDTGVARRAIRRAGGGRAGGEAVLLERAATIEDLLTTAGVAVHGWLDARRLAATIRRAWDPTDAIPADVDETTAAAVAGPAAVDDGWRIVRHDHGWSATVQIVAPPTRPATGDLLQHLLIGLLPTRRLSMLLIPTPAHAAERQAQTAQVSADAEQTLRTRWGFATSARQTRARHDAATREADVAAGRSVHRVVWLLTVTAATPDRLESDLATMEAAARRCGLVTRRLVGVQRQTTGFTLPLCRGAR